jgi:hypothetical protein
MPSRSSDDHMAGAVAVLLHDRLVALRWIQRLAHESSSEYELTATGAKMLQALGVDIEATRALRRRFAYGCLDWSGRRLHPFDTLVGAGKPDLRRRTRPLDANPRRSFHCNYRDSRNVTNAHEEQSAEQIGNGWTYSKSWPHRTSIVPNVPRHRCTEAQGATAEQLRFEVQIEPAFRAVQQ